MEPSNSSRPSTLSSQGIGNLETLDDLIRLRAAEAIQCPIIECRRPREDGVSPHFYTARDLDRMIGEATAMLVSNGLPSVRVNKAPSSQIESDLDIWESMNTHPIVALLDRPDLNMVIAFFALGRLGYTPMTISPALSGSNCQSLLRSVGCETIIHGPARESEAIIDEILENERGGSPEQSSYPSTDLVNTPLVASAQHRDPEGIALILHSSGSIGSPKPLFLSHRALMAHLHEHKESAAANPLPGYHLRVLSTVLQALYMRTTAILDISADHSIPAASSCILPDNGSKVGSNKGSIKAAKGTDVFPVSWAALAASEQPPHRAEGRDILRSASTARPAHLPESPQPFLEQTTRGNCLPGTAGMIGRTQLGLCAENGQGLTIKQLQKVIHCGDDLVRHVATEAFLAEFIDFWSNRTHFALPEVMTSTNGHYLEACVAGYRRLISRRNESAKGGEVRRRLTQVWLYRHFEMYVNQLQSAEHDGSVMIARRGRSISTIARDNILAFILSPPRSPRKIDRDALSDQCRWGGRWWRIASVLGFGVLLLPSEKLACQMFVLDVPGPYLAWKN